MTARSCCLLLSPSHSIPVFFHPQHLVTTGIDIFFPMHFNYLSQTTRDVNTSNCTTLFSEFRIKDDLKAFS